LQQRLLRPFVAFVIEDVTRRAEAEAAFLRAGDDAS